MVNRGFTILCAATRDRRPVSASNSQNGAKPPLWIVPSFLPRSLGAAYHI